MQSAATCNRKSLQWPWRRTHVAAGLVLLLTTIAACGGDGNAPPRDGSAPINTLAYVDTACRDSADGVFSATQELRVRRGESAPVTVKRVPTIGPLFVPVSYCGVIGSRRDGIVSLIIGAFQRLGVSPDGTALVFEVTDDNSLLGQSFVPPEQKGIFFVRADGSGLRPLGRASRTPSFTASSAEAQFSFSPNGRFVGFTDMGPGPKGDAAQAAQAFILNVETGERRQVTHLPPAPMPGVDGTAFGSFVNDRTISLFTSSNPDGRNPDGKLLLLTADIDGGSLETVPLVAVPGGGLIPVPVITGFERTVSIAHLYGVAPVNPMPGLDTVREVFLTDGTNVLQLTNFQRADTTFTDPVLSVDGERAFFTASDNATLGTNPSETCQIFSVDALGGDLHQLTTFDAGRRSAFGCNSPPRGQGCRTDFNYDSKQSQDARTGTLVFVSSCDPFGTNPNGQQIFAMRPDGSGLRPLTDARGVRRNPDGSVEVELPGPWSYGPHR